MLLTIFIWPIASIVGTMSGDSPHSATTSSRAQSCHSVCFPSRRHAHVRRVDVVSWPAKKKVLHSPTISGMPILDRFFWLPFISPWLDAIMSPSKSVPYESAPCPILAADRKRSSMSFLRIRLMLRFSFQRVRLNAVVINLHPFFVCTHLNKSSKMIQKKQKT